MTFIGAASEQAPFTSEIVGLILATESCGKIESVNAHYRKSWVCSVCDGFLSHAGSEPLEYI
jgi:hypothetical protein